MVTMDCDENPPLIHNSINRDKSESIEELTLPPSTTTIWRQLPISSYLRLPVNRFKKHKQTDSDSSDEDESSTTGGKCNSYGLVVWFMVFSATFNNISVISWRSVLLVEETGGPGENHRHASSH